MRLVEFRNKLSFQIEWALAFVLLFNSLSWYFLGQIMVDKIANPYNDTSIEYLILRLVYPISIIASGIIGVGFTTKVRKIRFFCIWLISGVLASLLAGIPVGTNLPGALIIITFIGSSLGLGMPACFGFFVNSIPIDKRGKVGGITFLVTSACVPLIAFTCLTLSLASSAVILAMWRCWSLVFLLLFSKESPPQISNRRKTSFHSVIRNKTFLLYFAAWLMFSLVDSFESEVLGLYVKEFQFIMIIIEPIVAGFSALVAGVLSDWVGRKRVMIFGFVSLGVAYAVLGIFSEFSASWIFFFIVDGMAIGLLWMLFTIVLWGDISEFDAEKYYAIGETPLFMAHIVSLLFAPYVSLIGELTSVFSLAAFFLFIAVIPLLYARETLPQRKIEKRQLKIYTEEALKMRQKTEQRR